MTYLDHCSCWNEELVRSIVNVGTVWSKNCCDAARDIVLLRPPFREALNLHLFVLLTVQIFPLELALQGLVHTTFIFIFLFHYEQYTLPLAAATSAASTLLQFTLTNRPCLQILKSEFKTK